jgi:signal transduction histidine kinase/ligand-binding sensor domain-containing protein
VPAEDAYGQAYLVHKYTSADGLPGSAVYDVDQDSRGRLWFSTRGGIACYDGVTWKPYTMENGLRLPYYMRLAVDRRDRVWVMSRKQGGNIYMSYFDGGRWHPVPVKENMPVSGGEGHTLALVESPGDSPYVAVSSNERGLAIWHRDAWYHLDETSGLAGNQVNSLASLKGEFYAATSKGVSIIRCKDTGQFEIDNRLNTRPGFPGGDILGVAAQDKDRYPGSPLKRSLIWLAGRGWLGYFEEDGGDFTLYHDAFPVNEDRRTLEIQPGYGTGVYIGNRMNLIYFNPADGAVSVLGVANGLAENSANGLFMDYERNIWVLGDRGASKMVSRTFGNYNKMSGLLEDEVTAVLEYKPGKFILGHNAGLTFWDRTRTGGGRMERFSFAGKTGGDIAWCRVLDVKMDSRENLWIPLNDAGLLKLDKHRQTTWYGKPHGLGNRGTGIWVDGQDRVWVGHNDGLSLVRGRRLAPVSLAPAPTPIVRKLHGAVIGNQEWLFIASRHIGVLARNQATGEVKHFRAPKGRGSNSVYGLYQDSRGRVLAGVQTGVMVIDMEKEIMTPFQPEGLDLREHVYFITEDRRHRLWIGTGDGVVRWDGKEAVRYSAARGLAGSETNRAGGWVDSRGRVWIGTNRGLSIYNEAFDTPPALIPPPRAHLLRVTANDRDIPLGKAIKLSANLHALEFHFRGVSFIDEKAVRFQYKLEGYDPEWNTTTNITPPRARYTHLEPGSYRFLVRAQNALGVWSETVSSPGIFLPAPFYKKLWFFAVLILAVVWLVYFITRFFTQRRYAGLLEKQVEERTEELKEVEQKLFQARKMEAIGTLAGGIAHDFNNILGAIVGYSELIAEDAKESSLMEQNARQVLKAALRASDLVRQILAFSRQSERERKVIILKSIIDEVLKLVRSSLPATIEIRTSIGSESGKVMADAAQMHQVLMNLCTNAAQAMKEVGGVLEIGLEEVILDSERIKALHDIEPGPYMKLTVRDTGQGIPKAVMKRIFEPYFTTKATGEGTGLGLAVIHGIIKGHRGDIEVVSERGKGTAFHVYLPRVTGDKRAMMNTPAPTTLDQLPHGSERILLLDDETALTDLGKKVLERLGYAVTGIADPEEALAVFREKPGGFDLVITDLTMPKMTGVHFAEEVKRIKPGIPVLLCSGFGAAVEHDKTHAGVDGYIMKPVIREELARKVREVLDR